jgi:hypothetical protein
MFLGFWRDIKKAEEKRKKWETPGHANQPTFPKNVLRPKNVLCEASLLLSEMNKMIILLQEKAFKVWVICVFTFLQ